MANMSTQPDAITSPATFGRYRRMATLSLRELLFWLITCFFALQLLQAINFQSLALFQKSLSGLNIFYLFAMFVVLSSITDSEEARAADGIDLALCVGLGFALVLTSFSAHRASSAVLPTILAGYLIVRYWQNRHLRVAGMVLLAICIHLVWAKLLYIYFTPQLLRADALAVAGALEAFGFNLTRTGTFIAGASGHGIQLVGACSSFHNVSMAVLALTAITMFVRPYWVRQDIYYLLAACAVMVAINVIRMCLMAISLESYAYWHGSPGAHYIAALQTISLVALCYLGARAGARR